MEGVNFQQMLERNVDLKAIFIRLQKTKREKEELHGEDHKWTLTFLSAEVQLTIAGSHQKGPACCHGPQKCQWHLYMSTFFFLYIYKVNVQDADDSSTIYTHLSREMLWHECISPKSYITQHKELEQDSLQFFISSEIEKDSFKLLSKPTIYAIRYVKSNIIIKQLFI